MKFTSALLAALCAVLSTAAAAREIPAACQSDATSLCPGMTPGDGKFGKCMKAHESQVSSGCKEAARALRKARHEHKAMPGKSTATPTTPSTAQ